MKAYRFRYRVFSVLILSISTIIIFSNDVNHKKTIQASKARVPVKIDGLLNEGEWNQLKGDESFTQSYPDPGKEPSFKTELKILFDEHNLYLGINCFDPKPDKIDVRMARRDREEPTDAVEIAIDSEHNLKEAFMFRLTASGTKIDAAIFNEFDEKKEWDAIWEGKSSINKSGWQAEIAIPFSQLRFTRKDDIVFGLQVRRDIQRLNESDVWVYIPPGSNKYVSAFGEIKGISNISYDRDIELIPFIVFKDRYHTRTSFYKRGFSTDAGIDFKIPLSTNFTVTGTLNPDFGQVEQDKVILNLSTFETFYPEKRPFFLEGFQIFSPPIIGDMGMRILHTRRIGSPPYEPVPEDGGKVISAPEQTTILGAAKITGTTSNGLTIGIFSAITQNERARLSDNRGTFYNELTNPQTLYGVIRINKNLWTNSTIGFMGTLTDRQEGRDSYVNALTWDLNFRENKDTLQGIIAESWLNNEGEKKKGNGIESLFLHKFNDKWTGGFIYYYYGHDFKISDLGYLRRNDFTLSALWFQRRVNSPTKYIVRANMNINMYYGDTTSGKVVSRGGNVNGNLTLKNYISLFCGMNIDLPSYDDRESREKGVLFYRPAYISGWGGFSTDYRKRVIWELVASGGNENHGRSWNLNGGPTVQFNDRASLSLYLSHSMSFGDFRWVDTITNDNDNNHIIFADLQKREWDMELRVSYIFTSDITLDLFTQVFDVSGHYNGFEELLSATRFADYPYHTNPDFHYLAWNLNLVWRWEFRPGCTVYGVISHGQEGSMDLPYRNSLGMSLNRDLSALTSSPSDDLLLFKFSYRF